MPNNKDLQILIEKLPDAVLVVDTDKRVLFSNPAAENLFGDDFQGIASLLIGASIEPDIREVKVARPDGTTRLAEMRSVYILWDSVPAMVVTLHDCTERYEREQQLEHFADTLVHDLRSPLSLLGNFVKIFNTDLTKQDYSKLEDIGRELTISTANILDLMNALRQFASSGKVTDMNDVDLDAVLKEVISVLNVDIKARKAEIHVDIHSSRVLGSRHLLEIVFQNLIANALKFNRSDGIVIGITVEPYDSGCIVQVSDNGIGIPKDKAESIFMPFQRLHTKHEFAGTGLGLATVKKIIDAHGGKIWVESEPGNGANFNFVLPGICGDKVISE